MVTAPVPWLIAVTPQWLAHPVQCPPMTVAPVKATTVHPHASSQQGTLPSDPLVLLPFLRARPDGLRTDLQSPGLLSVAVWLGPGLLSPLCRRFLGSLAHGI